MYGVTIDESNSPIQIHNTLQIIYIPYRVFFMKRLLQLRCQVEGCLEEALNWTNLRVHFAHRHARYTIFILEEGNQPYPRFPRCDTNMSHRGNLGYGWFPSSRINIVYPAWRCAK